MNVLDVQRGEPIVNSVGIPLAFRDYYFGNSGYLLQTKERWLALSLP
jgi:hypothetical protein